MTDTKRKPQEFWIREPQGPFDMKVYGKDWKDHCMPSDVVYHVIEKSVYDELKAKHERVLLALEVAEASMKSVLHELESIRRQGSYAEYVLMWDMIDKALAQIEELKK